MIIRFKCFCSSIKLKVEEVLWNIYLEITLVEKLLKKQLAENLDFPVRQALFLKYSSTKTVLKVCSLRYNVIQEYSCGKAEQIKVSLRS